MISNMNEEEFLLECDSVSNLSSLSGCTLGGGRYEMDQRMYDFLTVASDCSSVADLSNFEIEILEEVLVSDDKNNTFLANLSGHRTLLSFTSETSSTGSFGGHSDTEFEVQSETEFEYQSETEFEVESDMESESDDIMFSNHISLDQQENASVSDETNLAAMGAKTESASSFANSSTVSTASSIVSVPASPAANSVFEENKRLERARQRRTEALMRYKNIISTPSAHRVSAPATNGQQSLIHLVSAIEAMDGSAILAAASARAQSTSAGTTRVRELRSRQHESLKTFVATLESVHRDHKGAAPNNYFKRPARTTRPMFTSASASSKH